MRNARTRSLALAALAALVLPVASDQAMDPTCNATTSFASGITDPVSGDEAFFKQINPGSNVMLVIDNSGSMAALPDCDTNGWGSGGCSSPNIAAPASPGTNTAGTVVVNGTCAPASLNATYTTGTVPATSTLAWMEAVTPSTTFVDTGHGGATTADMFDCPPWGDGPGCTTTCKSGGALTDNCLFDPNAYYDPDQFAYGGTWGNNGGVTAVRLKNGANVIAATNSTAAVFDSHYSLMMFPVTSGTATVPLDLGAVAQKCLADKGFFIYNARYPDSKSGLNYAYSSNSTTGTVTIFRGTFLNSSPPKVVAARKVLKDVLWMDPTVAGSFDTIRFGLTWFGDTTQGALISPLVPTKSVIDATYSRSAYRKARQPMITFINAATTNSSGVLKATNNFCGIGATPTGRTLLNVGQYFGQQASGTNVNYVKYSAGGSSCTGGGSVKTTTCTKNKTCQRIQNCDVNGNNCTNVSTTPNGCNTNNCSSTVSLVTTPAVCSFAKGDWTTGSNCGSNCSNTGFAFTPTPTTNENCAVCYPSCQSNTAIFITDGVPNESQTSSQFPSDIVNTISSNYRVAPFYTDFNTTYCPNTCDGNGVFGAGNSTCCPDINGDPSLAPVVAEWMHLYNLWPTANPGNAVTVTTYTIGFNVPGGAANVLKAMGKMGGGDSFNATNFQGVASALTTFVSQASMKETSFAAPSVDTLQTNQSAASDAFLTRFIPNSTNTWEGHVFQAALFDEFGNGCDPTKDYAGQTLVCCNPGNTAASGLSCAGSPCGGTCVNPWLDGAGTTGRASCNRVFLVDNTCTPIAEDTQKGGFFRLDNSGTITNAAATLTWDAGAVLSTRPASGSPRKGYRSACEADATGSLSWAKPRSIFTWVPVGGTMTKVDFTTSNVSTLKPYLSIDPTWCTGLLNSIGWSPLPADQLTTCAKQIIYWVRGYDLFNKAGTGCRSPGHPGNGAACTTSGVDYGTERDRNADTRTPPLYWKLGDIFHSTPATIHTPANVVTCDLGYDSQCLATLHSPVSLPYQTPMKSDYPNGIYTRNAWDQYRADNSSRERVVLVGANDGMLHAFDAGTPLNTVDALGNRPFTDGTGEELWAFIPPDLLPKLWRLVKDGAMTDHQYTVDGPTMIRDVWVDGSSQSSTTLGTKDGTKQAIEFHTVAVVSERTGGTNYTALDVTDPTAPKVLWSFPRPLSEEAKYMGLSWTDFSGRPPPMGPVRLKLPTTATGQDPSNRGWEERWVVMLNGGYDPTLNRGRAVFMVDAWTGQTIWRVTDDDLKTGGRNNLGFGSGTAMFPVTGSVALLDLGDPNQSSFDMDGFFDTATWGDLGGNLWLARFQAPGEIGTSGRVENWFAARTFEQGRVDSGAQSALTRQPFYAMTSNAYESTTRSLRTFIGSGNREQLTVSGPSCGQNNLLACCQAGCAVSATVSQNFGGACGWSSTFACDSSGNMTHASVSDTPGSCSAATSCASSTSYQAAASVSISACTSPAATATGALACDAAGTCSGPASTPAFTQLGTGTVSVSGTTPPASRFFGVWSYGKDTTKTFGTLAEAVTFDANRFTDSATFTGTCAGGSCKLIDTTATTVSYNPTTNAVTAITGNKATTASPGWFYSYQGSGEKTGSGSTVVLGCTAWNGFMSTAAGPSTCSGSGGTNSSLAYLADFVSGVPTTVCGYGDGTSLVRRSTSQLTSAPPTTATVRVVVNAKGQVEYSALQLNPGAGPAVKSVGTRSQISEPVYWMEVPRDLHSCRHDPASTNTMCK